MECYPSVDVKQFYIVQVDTVEVRLHLVANLSQTEA